MIISDILNILIIVLFFIGIGIILILWSNIKAEKIMEDINKLIQDNSFKVYKSKNVSQIYFFLKRSFDLLFSLVGIIILIPIFIVVSILIKADSKGPVFIKKQRIGKYGEQIYIYNFRTRIYYSQKSNDVFSKEFTRIGLFLYKTSIDQLPMLLNVLSGKISIVGINTYSLKMFASLSEETQKKLIRHKPGITNLWAISLDKQHFNWGNICNYDLYYDSEVSLYFDFYIMIRTFAIAFAITSEY